MHYIAVVLFRRKWLMLVLFAAVASVVTAVSIALPKQYEARMKVLVKHERPDTVVSPESSSPAIRGEVTEEDVNAEVELLKSAELMRGVVQRGHTVVRTDGGGSGSGGSDAAVEMAVRKLTKSLNITPLRKTSIIQVTYTSEDPAIAASVLQDLAELYLQTHLRVHRTPGTYEFFRTQAGQYEKELSTAQSRLDDFRQRNNIVLLGEQKDLMLRRVMETEQASNEAGAAVKEASSRVEALQGQIASTNVRVVTQSRVVPNQYSVERLHTMLAELQNRRTELATKFNADDRLVRDVEKQISDTAAALERARAMTSTEQTTDVNPVRQALESERSRAELALAGLKVRKESLAAVLRESRARLAHLNAVTSEHDALSREVTQVEANAVLYAKKREEARISDLLDEKKFANVSIIESPVKPHLPSSSDSRMFVVAGCLLGLFVSVGVAFTLDATENSFDTAEELQSFAGVPVIAVVPFEGA